MNIMLNKFQKYNQENKLFNQTSKILLTVSGGKDSMAMLHLFKQNNISFGVAHCNFQLRGDDAIKDQQFVKQFCEHNKIIYHTVSFNTQEYAIENGISIQMAARELRYDWFEKIRVENSYQYIATAHHKNDVAETMLINLTKGTGLAGLHGISNKNSNIIRPLLCFDSSEIDDFVKENKIGYREDLSNADTKYTRNLIRHQIIPELEKINPSFIATLNTEANQFLGDEKIILDKIKLDKERLFVANNNGFKIDIKELKKLTPLTSYLYYFLRDYNFNSTDVSDIIAGLENQSGKSYYSPTHQIVKDREFLLLNDIEEIFTEKTLIKSIEDLPFKSELIEDISNLKIEKSNNYAYLDADKIQFPMVLRTWKNGDAFKPLGMNGNKKVSDFLIDNKISLVDKQHIKVLESNGQIIWLVGQRIDDSFKITPSTKKVFILSLND
ncbi:MAG: tRNA lysidine(34) synthetase TilS [Flavobacteriales bacterium]|nr:MAG: tRNA lysidine(34) synthetase TilS [Flavobacteriales bacterium]